MTKEYYNGAIDMAGRTKVLINELRQLHIISIIMSGYIEDRINGIVGQLTDQFEKQEKETQKTKRHEISAKMQANKESGLTKNDRS